mmetsp:Transcript_29970/g.47225  ORF Transcript_29970/g.47225 Transcript_29970/m.47225 type:complete len:200 (+) Transcript_29970:684-1283(+)
MTARWRCTAGRSSWAMRLRVFRPTYRMLLSRFCRKRPRMFTASMRRPASASVRRIVCTHSYRMALPAFLAVSVCVAVWARMSFMASCASSLRRPSRHSTRSSFTWRKGSVMPAMVCSGSNPAASRCRSIRIAAGTRGRKAAAASSGCASSSRTMHCSPAFSTPWCRSLSVETSASVKSSSSSGTRSSTRTAHRQAFLRR